MERYGFRPLEAVITALVGVIAVCYLIETVLARPGLGPGRLPRGRAAVSRARESVLLATGILGATVMPHVIFLHSALTQGRIVVRDPAQLRRLFRFEFVDVALAMGVAGLVNAAMLIMAAATFLEHGPDHGGHDRGGAPDAGAAAGPARRAGSSPSRCWPRACPPRPWAPWPGR